MDHTTSVSFHLVLVLKVFSFRACAYSFLLVSSVLVFFVISYLRYDILKNDGRRRPRRSWYESLLYHGHRRLLMRIMHCPKERTVSAHTSDGQSGN